LTDIQDVDLDTGSGHAELLRAADMKAASFSCHVPDTVAADRAAETGKPSSSGTA
jgi:hypothetical protein